MTEPPLSRRIEELAGYDEQEAETRDLDALAALRIDVVAVRAELASLRADLGGVRGDLDGLGGRLAGSVAAGRTETGTLVRRVAEIASRFDGLSGRMDDVRAELPGIAREVREGLELLPVRTGSQLDDVVGRVNDKVGARLDALASDLRRTVHGASEAGAKADAGTQNALVEARGALEARLAMVEDTLDGMIERLEALARDGATTTSDRLAEVLGGQRTLAERLEGTAADSGAAVAALRQELDERLALLSESTHQRLRDTTELLREEVREALGRTDLRVEEARGAVEELAGSTRTALEGFSGAVTGGLGQLSDSVTSALEEQRTQSRSDDEAAHARLVALVTGFSEEQRRRTRSDAERADAQLQALDGRVEALRSQTVTALADLRTDVATEIGVLRPALEDLSQATSGAAAASGQLRTELAESVAGLRDRLTATTAQSTEALRKALTETRTDMGDSLRDVREALLDRLQEQQTAWTARLGDVTTELAGTGQASREATDRLAAVVAAVEEQRRSVELLVAGTETRGRELDTALTALRAGLADTTTEQLAALAEATRERLEVLERGQAELVEAVGTTQAARLDAVESGQRERLDALQAAQATRLDEVVAAQAERLDALLAAQDERLTAVRDVTSEKLTAVSAEQAERFAAFEASTQALREVVGSFEAQWPTRTFEVVQGAKATAEAVVKEVRAELGRRLDDVVAALAATESKVEVARAGLDSGTDRLSQAGSVLVRYLEQRDRQLEADRDAILQDVLEQFAAGLTRLDRDEVADRVSTAANRRRDVRDAERYRAAVGKPVPPTLELPEEVQALGQEPAELDPVPVRRPSKQSARQTSTQPATRTGRQTGAAKPAPKAVQLPVEQDAAPSEPTAPARVAARGPSRVPAEAGARRPVAAPASRTPRGRRAAQASREAGETEPRPAPRRKAAGPRAAAPTADTAAADTAAVDTAAGDTAAADTPAPAVPAEPARARSSWESPAPAEPEAASDVGRLGEEERPRLFRRRR